MRAGDGRCGAFPLPARRHVRDVGGAATQDGEELPQRRRYEHTVRSAQLPESAGGVPAGSMLDLEFTAISDVGSVRDHNEDYLGHVLAVNPAQARSHGWLFVVADGVGGHELGEVASRTAVEMLLAGFASAPAGESHAALLSRLVQAANIRIYDAGMATRPGGSGMATTVVACALRYDSAVVAHVGDSRCYLIRQRKATALTRDHTVANEQVRLGLLSADEADHAPNRHVLSRCLGAEMFVNVQTSTYQISAGDVLVLCTDGLHGSMMPGEIAQHFSPYADLETAAKQLVGLANERDGSDNISVLAVRVRGVERVGMYRGRPYRLH